MSDDKESLELAAKACGVNGEYLINNAGIACIYDGVRFWTPLGRRSDCFQMEIDLKFTVIHMDDNSWHIRKGTTGLASHPDRQRASTMAAAEIGRSMT